MYKSLSNFKDLEKSLTYFKVYVEYPLPRPPIGLNMLALTENDLTDPNVLKHLKAYAKLLIEYCENVIRKTSFASKFKLVINFWGISRPFVKIKCQKIAEFEALKLSQGRKNNPCIEKMVKGVFSRWQRRWVSVGYNNIWYYESPEDEHWKLRDCIPMDLTTSLKILEVDSKNGVIFELYMSRRRLQLSIKDFVSGLYALWSITKAFMSSTFAVKHRFHSFAPPRMRNDVEFFIDGEGYFNKLHDLIKEAETDIMICGWFISPEMPLKRPIRNYLEYEESRLDNLLAERANKGVKIYILVYKEVTVTMYNDSLHCKNRLESLSKNIRVIRHPATLVSYWSHHEKMVIVDRRVVMMGGLDICWGRWDTQSHTLFDNTDLGCLFPSVDYYNPFKKDLVKGREYHRSLIDRSHPRMPWHDVAVMLTGEVVFDFMTHFMTYWNNAREQIGDSSIEVLFPQMPLFDPRVMLDSNVVNGIKNLLRSRASSRDPPSPNFGRRPYEAEDRPDFSRESSAAMNKTLYRQKSLAIFTKKHFDNSSDSEDEPKCPTPLVSPSRKLQFTDINLIKVAKDSNKADDYEEYEFPYGEKLFEKLDEIYANKEAYFEAKPSFNIPEELVDENGFNPVVKLQEYQLLAENSRQVTIKLESMEEQSPKAKDEGQPPGMEASQYERSRTEGEFRKMVDVQGSTAQNSQSDSKRKIMMNMANGYTPVSQQKVRRQSNLKHTWKLEHFLYPVPDPQKKAKLEKVPEEEDGVRKAQSFENEDDYYLDPNRTISLKYKLTHDENDDYLEVGTPIQVRHPETDPASCKTNTLKEKKATVNFPHVRKKAAKQSSFYQIDAVMEMQALRSASDWSIGLYELEHSIQNSYIATIMAAKRFVYIENQFFISNTDTEIGTNKDSIKNRVVKALYARLKNAIKNNEDFKVIIFIPLLPAFEGDLEQKNGHVMQIQIALENMTIGVGDKSFIAKVKELTDEAGTNVEDYVMICGLRKLERPPQFPQHSPEKVNKTVRKTWCGSSNHSKSALDLTRTHLTLSGDPKSEPQTGLIYIHSKVSSSDAVANR